MGEGQNPKGKQNPKEKPNAQEKPNPEAEQNLDEEQDPNEELTFELVTSTIKVAGGALRDPASASLSPSGRLEFNTTGGEMVLDLILLKKLDIHNVAMLFGANEKAKMVAGYVVKPGTDGAMPLKNTGGVVTGHMGNVFEKHPKLRPTSEQTVRLTFKDKANPPYILFNLQTAFPKVRRKATDPPQPETAQEGAAAKKETKGQGRKKATPPTTETAGGSEPQDA